MAGSELDSVRHQMALLARRSRARRVGWEEGMPSEWRPETVWNPKTNNYFTPAGAWFFIADLLDSGYPIWEVILKNPMGKKAYTIEVQLQPDRPIIYIKLQLGAGIVIGRSFHYSEKQIH